MPAKEVAGCVGRQCLTCTALQTKMRGQQILYDLQSSSVAFFQSYKLAFFTFILCGIHLEVHLWEYHFAVPIADCCKKQRWGVPRLLRSQHLDMQCMWLVVSIKNLYWRRGLWSSETSEKVSVGGSTTPNITRTDEINPANSMWNMTFLWNQLWRLLSSAMWIDLLNASIFPSSSVLWKRSFRG